MNKLMALIILGFSFAALAETRVTGSEAEALFNGLAGQYEYQSGAKVSGLSIETVVRHDNESLSCSKETVVYSGSPETVNFECIIK